MSNKNDNGPRTPVTDRIARARHLERTCGDALRRDAAVQRLIVRVEATLAASFQAMVDTGVIRACTRCDEEEGGSCCGAGIENQYNETLLLVNLLFGIELPSDRLRENSCFFLGDKGCSLKVRQVLCVNYLCRAIQESLDLQSRDRLQEAVGAELEMVFLLEEAVRRVLSREGALGG